MKKGGRELTADDRAIWKRVTRTVTPKPDYAQKQESADFAKMLQARGPYMRVTPQARSVKTQRHKTVEPTQDKRVRRGRVDIERRIDLHDMTRDQARPALFNAVRAAYARGEKCLLVITGKGLRLNGVLRQTFPNWINADEIRPMIASYAQSHIRHGGTGAWYVFLKRKNATK